VQLRELQVEMIDRFGLLPEYAKNLFAVAELKAHARELGIRKVDVGPGGGSITFANDTTVDVGKLIRYVQANSKTHRFDGTQKIRFVQKMERDSERFAAAEKLLTSLK
jgi:transcription-repair coupling factor (superfamily II helicase)